jgi:hypothetical protein
MWIILNRESKSEPPFAIEREAVENGVDLALAKVEVGKFSLSL